MATELSAAPVLSTPAEQGFEYAVVPSETEAQLPPRDDEELLIRYDIAGTAIRARQKGWKRFSECISRLLEKITILADTSYSACCVDEIAAEHADADVVVHYGRSCLSPTSRLPVIYVFTYHNLDRDETVAAFEKQYPDKDTAVVLMADVTYQEHIRTLASKLHIRRGYTNLLSTDVIHDPTGLIPNRRLVIPRETPELDPFPTTLSADALKTHSIFHISQPPTALLLALASRVHSLHIHPTPSSPTTSLATNPQQFSTPRLLRRRYARLLTLASAGIVGILVIRSRSPLPVLGRHDPQADRRVPNASWWGGIERVGEGVGGAGGVDEGEQGLQEEEGVGSGVEAGLDEDDDEEESAPPEFDLRTGKLVSHSRPMRNGAGKANGKSKAEGVAAGTEAKSSSALALRPKAELATVNGVVSPGAEYLRAQRTWQGLGSDYVAEESTAIEEGRSGIARGYTVGSEERR
ncbi:hypothetical protein CHGG_09775 [Chaetomium globosum CBS 148.51]|uniref:2-(3-amino-3-carboxypropyl)histidine synthase n=1 Tax=Chaetomium globosum (strain ATCC 6205 / CBS 148.51 / DSM 1962 / NBRC 6347 / NRRL 1970) TaxID=306901 RepID=Q2GQH9_CHAGB|nr:uncharacterized protein CHGG_09775 [Chaetomium globosum CBS 148.51]EAQ83371.1 hypothetical protein CHGG_09775 [Chaetomium globosum CBS 148.51]